jgi:hypothetical protein
MDAARQRSSSLGGRSWSLSQWQSDLTLNSRMHIAANEERIGPEFRTLAVLKYFQPSTPSHERLPAYQPGAAPARPSGPNRSALLQCEREPGRARWPRQHAVAVGEFHRIARAPTSWRTPSKGFPRGRLREFLAFLRALAGTRRSIRRSISV